MDDRKEHAMEDYSNIVQFISTVGFPIFCCVIMALYVKYQTDKNREDMLTLINQNREDRIKLDEQHKEEMNDFKIAIDNNTIALTKLCEKMG